MNENFTAGFNMLVSAVSEGRIKLGTTQIAAFLEILEKKLEVIRTCEIPYHRVEQIRKGECAFLLTHPITDKNYKDDIF